MNGLKMRKNKAVKFFAAETHGAVEMLKHLVLQLYWSALLALVLQYTEGTLGDMKGFAAYTVGLRLLKIPFELQLICKSEVLWYLHEILQKLDYMEKRQMKENYSSGDTTRQVRADVEAYDSKQNNPKWLKRRLRAHFEDWKKANEGLADHSKKTLKEIWSLVCTEVQLRSCRDIAASRAARAEKGKATTVQVQQKEMWILENLQIQVGGMFWSPLKKDEWQDIMGMSGEQHYVEICLGDQLMEREEELKAFASEANNATEMETIFAGMPELVKSFIQSSGSSSGLKKGS
jgi:hypothetical protein